MFADLVLAPRALAASVCSREASSQPCRRSGWGDPPSALQELPEAGNMAVGKAVP